MNMNKKSFLGLMMVLIILSINMSFLSVEANGDLVADVLVYTGAGAWSDGVLAFEKFLEFKGLNWLECDGSFISNNELVSRFNVIHFPGGDSGDYIANIDTRGLQHIRDFVASGGGVHWDLCRRIFCL